MANVSVFNVSGGSVALESEVAAAAAVQSVPPGKDARMALRISNGNETATISVVLKAGDGPRAVLGDKSILVAAGQTAYIALFDTARHKRYSDGAVSVELKAAGGGALTAEQLSSLSIEAVQL